MTHLPADHFLKLILPVQPSGPWLALSQGICGLMAPTIDRPIEVEGPATESDARSGVHYARTWQDGEQVHGYFTHEHAAKLAERLIVSFRDSIKAKGQFLLHQTGPDFEKWREMNAVETQSRWVLRFPDDGRTLAEHMSLIDCPRCRVALDAFLESRHLTIELEPRWGQEYQGYRAAADLRWPWQTR